MSPRHRRAPRTARRPLRSAREVQGRWPDATTRTTRTHRRRTAWCRRRTLLVVEVGSPSNTETDRVVKRRRYGQYGAPLYLLVDRQNRSCALFSEPTRLGYAAEDGPHPFGVPVRLPAPFDLELDTGRL
ncbi:Uma2 family endonuclease [Kitasatospora sp. NPDC090091]|uniref:Uma2 family endonuclease n=1 Tax=Kitasatospora sp. NPDC090091 TaxID=3364081 RepID=UPI0038285E82